MRAFSLLALSLLALPAPAQGIVVPVRCQGECTPGSLTVDSVAAWANLEHGRAMTYVNHVFSNGSDEAIDGAFFFPLPADAIVERITVRQGEDLQVYNEWSGPQESRWILEGLARERRDARLREYAGAAVVHVRIPAIPGHGVKHMQIGYSQPLRAEGGVIAYRYPLSLAAAAPAGHVRFGMTIKTEAGFRDVGSPSHAVDVQWGMEPGPCLPRERCGTRGFPSERVRVIRLLDGEGGRLRDFELRYTPAPAERDAASVP
ncbi:MAG TPA: hypothetical protein VFT45_22330 [Longimicrobium sp.]|nr:hypothetical protein [Longimicrobium sp.]